MTNGKPMLSTRMTNGKPLLMYRIDGDVAARLFGEFPEAAEDSGIENPNDGVGAILSWEPDSMKELLAALRATKKLIQDNDVKQLLLYKEEIQQAGITLGGLLLELTDFFNMAEESDED